MSSAESPATSKRRIPLFDNARFMAILLVVTGHAIQPLQDGSDAAAVTYLVIYAFHVPLFVLVSGYFAKDSLDRTALARLVTDLAVPYLIFETIWTFVQWLVEGNTAVNYVKPSWTLWFLLALIGWRLLLPLLAITRYPLLVSVIIAIAAGYTDDLDNTLALSRTLGLLPFFVLGWRLRTWAPGGKTLTERWEGAADRTVTLVRAAAAALFVGLLVVTVAALPAWRELGVRYFFFYDDAYSVIDYDQWWAGALRLGALGVGAAFSAALLVLLPRQSTWYTGLGGSTLYIYLLHTGVLYPLRESGILADNANDVTFVVMVVAAFVITLVLASNPVRRIFRPLVEPRVPRLMAPGSLDR